MGTRLLVPLRSLVILMALLVALSAFGQGQETTVQSAMRELADVRPQVVRHMHLTFGRTSPLASRISAKALQAIQEDDALSPEQRYGKTFALYRSSVNALLVEIWGSKSFNMRTDGDTFTRLHGKGYFNLIQRIEDIETALFKDARHQPQPFESEKALPQFN